MADGKVCLFEEKEFESACDELEQKQVDGYEFFTESHGVTIYRLYNEKSGLYEYKVYGELEDVDPEVCAQVYMDLEYRKIWDTYVNELREIESSGRTLIYWHVNFPWPMSHRDYVYKRDMRVIERNGQKVWAVLAKSAEALEVPEKDGIIRVDDYVQSCVLTSNGKVGSKAYMRYYDNPKGSIPTWLINWGAKTGVPGFLTIMQKACRGYPDYLRSKQASQAPQ